MIARMRRDASERLAGDDSGATLILVLLLVTVVSLVVGATLSLTDTSIRTTIAVRSQAANSYDAQGAVDAAINTLRNSTYNNDVSSPSYPKCFGNTATSNTLVLPNFYPGSTGSAAASAAVTCSPDPTTGAAGPQVPIHDDNKPGNAILTLSTNTAETGLSVKALGPSVPFVVHGGVVSDTNIAVSNGSLQSNTTVTAHTGCSGSISATPAADCNAGTVSDPGYKFNPYYDTGGAVPAYQVAPTPTPANCPGGLVTFYPGYYDDAAALNAITNGPGSNPCKHGVWWFKPGTYYFDFHNSSNPLLSGGSDVWTLGDGQLIAGTPVNSGGAVLVKPTVPTTVPGACQNPIETTGHDGVQFIFGGDSQLVVSGSADAEICGSYQDHRPPIALYGLSSGTETPVNPATPYLLTSVTNAVQFSGATVPNLANGGDGLAATWQNTANGNQAGGFTVSGFAPATAAPAGSVLTSASLTVRYSNTNGSSQDSRTVTITPRSATGVAGTAIPVTLPSTSGNAAQTATVDLYGSGLSALATAFHSFGYSGASAAYSLQTKHKDTESVDTVQLSLNYTPPGYRGETTLAVPGNCLAAINSCSLLSTFSSYHGNAYIQGTTYAPAASIDLTLSNITAQVLRFGVISRTLTVKETGAISYIGPVIEIPDNSTTYGPGGTVVYLTAYVCEAAATCSAAGKLSLRARVLVYDPSGTPTVGSRQIIVQSWAMQR